jgi:glutaredoxin
LPRVELFGSGRCEHTESMREWLEWRGVGFVEYDVDVDPAARARMKTLAPGQRVVPVLVEDGTVAQIGWQGRGCVIGDGD